MSIKTDVVIIGAGPCGLFQVFELGLLGIRAHVVDTLPEIGGQCAALYPDKPIYDIPALPVVGAQELVERLEEQIRPFEPELHLGEMVVKLAREADGAFSLETSAGTRFLTRTVVVAGGLGSFQPRPLRVAGVERHVGVNVDHKVLDKARYRGQVVTILGGGDSALDWALELAPAAKSLTLVHRREGFRAQPVSVERLRAMAQAEPDRVRILIGRTTGLIEEGDTLTGIEVEPFEKDAAGTSVRFDELLVFYGLSPNLGPIAEWGLGVEKRQIPVDTEKFQTSVPGIFAIGDINTYPGKKKLILSGFHEAALVAFAVQRHLDPNARQFLQYTTTSPVMHERLGVSGEMAPDA
ncbi:MAG: NAD(P)/FAD-dependent oxidoreductase [Thiotrichales bacterium]|nr:NAD(P)/FAD-dependent oxidoreductase [Thiotrichales bacterium]MCY4348685.1 NAD(P)/FAD-dependent oxidoreductase [Thiotrichales bacterium]